VVLRFANREIIEDTERVLQCVRAALSR
jgi:hypothetical protein